MLAATTRAADESVTDAALDPKAMREPLPNAWYCVGQAPTLKAGGMRPVELNSEQIVVGRDGAGALFAMRDRCPHRGMALSKGRFDGDTVMCPFHGWRFGTDGRCRDVPTLSEKDASDFSRIAVQRFPIVESAGFLWVNPHLGPAGATDLPAVPELGFEAAGSLVVELEVEASFDLTTLSLVDPGHVAFVHDSWWFRPSKELREKVKTFQPVPHGFVMSSHATTTSSPIYKLLGGAPEVEIEFRLPGIRLERIVAGEKRMANYTFATPLTNNRTMLTNALYWSMPLLNLLKPLARPLMRQFLTQDQQVLQHAQAGLDRKPTMVLLGQGDLPSQWYFRLKREALEAARAGRSFENPLSRQELRWRS
ncbi:aromatic ring-hydroxylating oxygenase subunit alpha [Methylobacterium haplocladii]|uniref:(2Fe-2S)-binding protein n=1 Tax=Methylobacterium haplocladii TaxID=1176176 RepID=A0A512IUH1_9HYPH|nr:aromatic ring-hydroxylating dioxygenase subunit alpha [Methylobacterium haplocladii]GEP01358.1 (2Fe-2S)-binding protein [Methylobacterium haplocladii]GJD83840.1 Carnitine monooxygenase oxygenase subunit [Methylobacterium haplocladii]GLS58249.1 (2Fe-2S)-binding protein [Methylobacterium haplocladii]